MGENSLNIQVQIQPGSSKDQIIGLHNGRLKIKISAPPVDGKANQNLIEFISKALGVSKSKIEILKGRTSKLKTLKISGVDQQSFSLLLNKYRES
ncbi:MAG: DUF167 domain-containing protein [Candidatus Dadabacteria bacterium]|nr:DUF167 domain-containing protein [Candidatus Dadabacteria bacterium]